MDDVSKIRHQFKSSESERQNPPNFIMKMFIAFAALVAVALAAPQGHSDVVVVKESPSNNIGVDGYEFGFELSDGSARQESAQLRNAGSENEALVVSGSFTYVDPASNQRYTVTYTADENGFHPVGDHIPA